MWSLRYIICRRKIFLHSAALREAEKTSSEVPRYAICAIEITYHTPCVFAPRSHTLISHQSKHRRPTMGSQERGFEFFLIWVEYLLRFFLAIVAASRTISSDDEFVPTHLPREDQRTTIPLVDLVIVHSVLPKPLYRISGAHITFRYGMRSAQNRIFAGPVPYIYVPCFIVNQQELSHGIVCCLEMAFDFSFLFLYHRPFLCCNYTCCENIIIPALDAVKRALLLPRVVYFRAFRLAGIGVLCFWKRFFW